MTAEPTQEARDRRELLFDFLPFWGLALACYVDGRCDVALAVAVVGPLFVLLDSVMPTPPAAPARTEEW